MTLLAAGPGDVVVSGSLLLAAPIAFAAGLISFLSPCVLPLVPGYLGYISGVTGAADQRRGRTVAGAGLFVLGFAVVFLPVFLLSGTIGALLLQWRDPIIQVGGAIVMLLGLVFIGQVTVLQRQFKVNWRPRSGLIGAPVLGTVFAVGWTPCIGPTLVAAGFLAGYGGDPWRALLIGLAYCIGLGVPFLLIALGFGWVGTSVAWVRRHLRAINIGGGVLLIAVGILMLSGIWGALLTRLGAVIGGVQLPI
ncbi:MAG: cytochrome c biogenesis protein CcdA [Micrococcales bacterium]|nr:cytochrome c biogenesis protein CcdA [Micrococcales bacterium]